MKRCTKCILPETFPMISFDNQGVCNYCKSYVSEKKKFDVEDLEKILAKYRSSDGGTDCIVTFSGGRDSCYVLYRLVKDFNMHPLAVTYDWGLMTPEAQLNRKKTTEKLGVKHTIIKADIDNIKWHIHQNVLAWLKKPHPGLIPLFTQGDKTMEYYISKVAKERNISLIITGNGNFLERTRFKTSFLGVNENAESNELSFLAHIKLMFRYIYEFLRNPRYINSSLIELLKAYFVQYLLAYESTRENWIRFFLYIPWDEDEILSTIRRELNWKTPKDTILTWRIDDGTAPFYNYLYYRMVGFTENDAFRNNQVKEGVLTREKALKIVEEENKPRYKAIKQYLKFVNLNYGEIMQRIDEISQF